MKNTITYVGIDAHKKDLFIAMLVGNQATPVAWTVPNEPNAVRRLVRKLEREAPVGPRIDGPIWGSCRERTPAARNIGGAASREPGTRWSGGCWSKRRGTTNIARLSGPRSRADAKGSRRA